MDLRIGIVSEVNGSDRTARVRFLDVDIVSGWLKIIYRPMRISGTQAVSGGSGEAAFASHSHPVSASEWMPSVGDNVLCIYGDGFSSDGYVLGALT